MWCSYSSAGFRRRKWSPPRRMLMTLQRCLGGTNRDSEYNWVILMCGPKRPGVFVQLNEACKRMTAEPGDQTLFPIAFVLSIPDIPGRIFWGKYSTLSLHTCCPAKEMKRGENASLLQVSCSLHTTMCVLMCLQLWSLIFFSSFLLFLLPLISKCFHD